MAIKINNVKMNLKTMFYIVGAIIVFFLLSRNLILEGYQSTYKNFNDDKSTDLPLNFPFNCKNFCGPNNTCAITGEPCSKDYDCTGCQITLSSNSNFKPEPEPYYDQLNDNHLDSVYVGSKNNLPMSKYNPQISDPLNQALKIYNEREMQNNPLSDFEKKIKVEYPTTISMTGEYYETFAPPYNK